MLACCARPGGELKPTEDQLEGLKRLLNEVSCAVSTVCTAYFIISQHSFAVKLSVYACEKP